MSDSLDAVLNHLSSENLIFLEDKDLHKLPKNNPPGVQNLPTSATELTITIRDSEKTQKTKHLVYEQFYLNDNDPIIKSLIAQAMQEFNAEPEAIRIRASLVVL